ncbi:MAG: DUF1697 domain-containing protein, partial [Candidatus Dormibacteria bacterium]
DVATHIQSGNAVFTTGPGDATALARALEGHLHSMLSLTTVAFVMTLEDLEAASRANPFRPKGSDDTVSHVMFLDAEPDARHRAALMSLAGDDYRFAVKGRVLYYAYPRSSVGRRRQVNFEKMLGVRGTARTYKVVDALISMLRERSSAGRPNATGRGASEAGTATRSRSAPRTRR